MDKYLNIVPKTTVINIRTKNLKSIGYKNIEEWLRNPNHVYIGRDMTHRVPGCIGSKWGNVVYDRDKYRDYILSNRELLSQLHELKGKILGCWCKPKLCHGDIICELVNKLQ